MLETAAVGTGAVLALGGVASLVAMVIVAFLCVCVKGNKSKETPVVLQEVESVPEKTRNGLATAKVNGDASATEVMLDVEQGGTLSKSATLPPATTSVESRKKVKEHTRVKSQDHRALPEIPSLLQGVMQTDDEDEDDGHYDVISGNRRARGGQAKHSTAPTAVKSAHTRQPRKGHNPYEKVSGDPDSDIMYPGMKEPETDPNYEGVTINNAVLQLEARGDFERGEGSDSTYAGIRDSSPSVSSVDVGETKPPQEEYPAVADVTYAQIEDKAGRARPRPQPGPAQLRDDPSQLYTPPPVPHKNYEPGDEAGHQSLNTSTGPESLDLSSSPSLPPRNSSDHSRNGSAVSEGAGVAITGHHLYETPSDPGPSAAGDGTGGGVRTVGALVASDVGAAGAAALPCFSDTNNQGIREPRYSSVTARESLDNLKRRQAHPLQVQQQQLQAAAPPPTQPLFDADYASVDYDEIKSPGASSGGPMSPPAAAADRNSISSDLYAEIASGSGQASARSSTYARVDDFGNSNSQAPPPPSVEVLRQLSNPRDDGEDDIPDPGYSRIKVKPRPASVHSSSTASMISSQPPPVLASGRRSPVYALVDKSSKAKHRQTVHVDGNMLPSQHRSHNGPSLGHQQNLPTLDSLYTQVNKSKNGQRGGNNQNNSRRFTYDNIPTAGAMGGARPKVKDTGGSAGHGASEASGVVVGVDPGYQTIGSVEAFQISGTHHVDVDRLRRQSQGPPDSGSDYDPNYERVTDLKRPSTSSEVNHEKSTGGAQPAATPSNGSTGRKASSHQRSTKTPQQGHGREGRPKFPWQNQEHIYQEINEARQDQRHNQRHLVGEGAFSTGL